MNLPALTAAEIRHFADSLPIYYRGEDCYASGAIEQFSLNAGAIQARVRGNSGNYNVAITNAANRLETQCNCLDDSYVCEHIIAVLLHQLRRGPDLIALTPPHSLTVLEQALDELSHRQIRDFVLDLAQQKCEVRRLLLAAIRFSPQLLRQQMLNPVQVNYLQQQISHGLSELKYQSEYSDYYYDREYAEDEPAPLLESALEEARMLHPTDQLAVFWHVVTAGNQLFSKALISPTPIAIALRLYAIDVTQLDLSPPAKQPYFNALLAACNWQMCQHGNLTEAIKAALDQMCTAPADYRYLIEQFEESDAAAIDWIAGYYRQLGDDENYLRVRQSNLWREEQYVELAEFWHQRGDRAAALATLETGALYLVETRYQAASGHHITPPKSSLLFDQLANYYRQIADNDNLCRVLVMTVDYCGVTLALYRQIEALANQLEQWLTLRPELLKLARLNREVLAKIYLYERNWQAALELADQKNAYEPLRVLVADGIKHHHPASAIAIYKALVQAHIERQDRKCRVAAGYVRAVKSIYLTVLKDEATWQGYRHELCDRYRRDLALQDELHRL